MKTIKIPCDSYSFSTIYCFVETIKPMPEVQIIQDKFATTVVTRDDHIMIIYCVYKYIYNSSMSFTKFCSTFMT